MKRLMYSLVLVSIPLLMMLQVLQSYRYVVTSENIQALGELQVDRLEENRRLMASIAVLDSPERVYSVSSETIGLQAAEPVDVLQVRFPDGVEVLP